MRKMLLIGILVVIVLSMTVPAAFAWRTPPGNNTWVTVNGRNNAGTVVVNGWGNNTSLYYGGNTAWNVAVVGVMGCKNNTSVSFGYGAKYNTIGVAVVNPCR